MKIAMVKFESWTQAPGTTHRADSILADKVDSIELEPAGLGIEVKKNGKTRFYPWSRIQYVDFAKDAPVVAAPEPETAPETPRAKDKSPKDASLDALLKK